jgi:hypothetical protein
MSQRTLTLYIDISLNAEIFLFCGVVELAKKIAVIEELIFVHHHYYYKWIKSLNHAYLNI